MLTPLHDQRSYLCPGEVTSIGRSVHLSRMAASFAKCAACPHCNDVNSNLPPAISAADWPQPRQREFQRVAHGFRGRYGDPLDRSQAMHWAAALAALLWDERIERHEAESASENRTLPSSHSVAEEGIRVGGSIDHTPGLQEGPRFDGHAQGSPGIGSAATISSGARAQRPAAPQFVIGYDERLGSPDLFTGAVRGLERMSCRVLDIGLITEPCLRFAVQQVDADAGLFVTGAGCDPAWNGFDLFRRSGLPPESVFLDRWQAASNGPISRPSRSPGHVVAYSLSQQYEAALVGRFHAVRPLTIVVGAASRQLQARIENLFARLPGRMKLEAVPVRRRNLSDRRDPDHLRIGRRVRDGGADLGIVIGDDGTECSFLDERGELIDAVAWQLRIIDHLLRDDPHGTIILDTQQWDQLAPQVTSAGGKPILVASADRPARLMFESGLAAFGGDHRVWFGGETPVGDAIATLAAVWQALSRSDAPASEAFR